MGELEGYNECKLVGMLDGDCIVGTLMQLGLALGLTMIS